MIEMLHGYYLTVDECKNNRGEDTVLAIISDGSPQHGHQPVTVLTLESFPIGTPYKKIKKWFQRMKKEKPWEPRH